MIPVILNKVAAAVVLAGNIDTRHTRIKIYQNRKIFLQSFDIWCKSVLHIQISIKLSLSMDFFVQGVN